MATKLTINVVARVVLLLYLQTLADRAAATPAGSDLDPLRSGSPVLHAGVAHGLLGAAVALSVFKPAGRTRCGWRRARRAGGASSVVAPPGR